MKKKLSLTLISLLAITTPIMALTVISNEAHVVSNKLNVLAQPSNSSLSLSPADFEFVPATWNDTGISSNFSNRFATTIANYPTEAAKLEKSIKVPQAWIASGYLNPEITIHGDDSNGTIRISYDYQKDTGTKHLPLPLYTNMVFRHTYSGFNQLSNFKWTIDSTNVNFNQLPSIEAATQTSITNPPAGIQIKGDAKMNTLNYGPPEYSTTANDSTGELFMTVTYPNTPPNVPNLVKTQKFTISNFYTTSTFNVAWDVGGLSSKFLKTSVPDFVTPNDINTLITDKAITFGSGFNNIIPTIRIVSHDSRQGYLTVQLTFTDPSLPNGSMVFNNTYTNLYNIGDYTTTLDPSKVINLDKKHFASKAKPSDFLNAFIPSPAIVAVDKHYSGSVSNIKIHAVDDVKGSLVITYDYPAVSKVLPIWKGPSLKVVGYSDVSLYTITNWNDSTLIKDYGKTLPSAAETILSNNNNNLMLTYPVYSPALKALGVIPTVKYTPDNTSGELKIELTFAGLPTTFTHTYKGFETSVFNFIDLKTLDPKALLAIPSEIDKNFNINNPQNFIDPKTTNPVYSSYVYSKANPNGAKVTLSAINDKDGTFTMNYDFTNAKDSKGNPFPAGWPETWGHIYDVEKVDNVIKKNPPKKKDNADYSISADDVNANNAANYVTVDQRLIDAGYKASYKVNEIGSGSIGITIIYTKGSDTFESKTVTIDGFKVNTSSWFTDYWWIIIIISCILVLTIFFLFFILKRRKREKIVKERVRNSNRSKIKKPKHK